MTGEPAGLRARSSAAGLQREGTDAVRCTVERLLRKAGLRGMIIRTTAADAVAPCLLDRVNHRFNAQRSNQVWVSDFTRVSTLERFVYAAFITNVFARHTVG